MRYNATNRRSEQRGAMKEVYDVKSRIVKKHRQDLQSGIPAARVIEIPGANYYIFLSNEHDVFREVRTFSRDYVSARYYVRARRCEY